MQLIIKINLEQGLTLPLAHHHILQAVLYAPLRNDAYFSQLHEQGAMNGKRDYKLFTFSPIMGHYAVANHRITFDGEIELEVRSCNEELLERMADYFQTQGIRFGDSVYKNVEVRMQDVHVESDDIVIQMISPMCAHETNESSGYTRYFNPREAEFYRYIESNFERKYRALHPSDEITGVSLSQIKVTKLDKYVTRYKDFIIEGYKGIYRLTGPREYLDFLYQVGLGEKNSQGFGMFMIVD